MGSDRSDGNGRQRQMRISSTTTTNNGRANVDENGWLAAGTHWELAMGRRELNKEQRRTGGQQLPGGTLAGRRR